ncbi:MAG TPA: hypothetical protein VFN62_03845 [Acidobacteriaceae bacterium]|nr:hypothetical protein [Acidobacteriaceae bacterium]
MAWNSRGGLIFPAHESYSPNMQTKQVHAASHLSGAQNPISNKVRMMALSKNTKDHDAIRQWAESRGAVPSEVAATETDDEPGLLRFQFPKAKNRNDAALKEISWDEFFEKFDENDLTLVYQEKTASGRKSNFNKLVHDESVRSSASKKKATRSASSGSRSRQSA